MQETDPMDPVEASALRRLAMLEELAEIGMEIARSLRPGAEAETPVPERRDPAAAFAQVSRAIRLTLNLEAKTWAELRDWQAGADARREERRVRVEAAGEERMARAHDLVVAVIDRETRDPDEYDDLWEALQERLTQDEAYVDGGERPLRETVERLCHDLGLTPDWDRWGEDGWIEDDGPQPRPSWSIYNQTSRKRLVPRWPPQVPPQLDAPRPP